MLAVDNNKLADVIGCTWKLKRDKRQNPIELSFELKTILETGAMNLEDDVFSLNSFSRPTKNSFTRFREAGVLECFMKTKQVFTVGHGR